MPTTSSSASGLSSLLSVLKSAIRCPLSIRLKKPKSEPSLKRMTKATRSLAHQFRFAILKQKHLEPHSGPGFSTNTSVVPFCWKTFQMYLRITSAFSQSFHTGSSLSLNPCPSHARDTCCLFPEPTIWNDDLSGSLNVYYFSPQCHLFWSNLRSLFLTEALSYFSSLATNFIKTCLRTVPPVKAAANQLSPA